MAKEPKMIDASALIKILELNRKKMNKMYSRSDVYANGLKSGIDDAIRHVKGMRDGKTYIEDEDVWVDE